MTVLSRVLVGLLLSLTGGIVASPSVVVAHSALGQTKSANTISVSDAPTPLSLAHSALYSVRASTEAAASATMGNSASIESAGVAAKTVRPGATFERMYEGGGGVLAQVDEAVILNLAIERGPASPAGGAMFNEALSSVGPVNGIRGTWTTAMPSNLDAFNANIRAGMSVTDAARSTFTCTMAGRSGFSSVTVEQLTGSPGAYTNVKEVFGR